VVVLLINHEVYYGFECYHILIKGDESMTKYGELGWWVLYKHGRLISNLKWGMSWDGSVRERHRIFSLS
jgi:hypothetical protein